MQRIPTYLITGFLGSGKTTLIKRILDTYALGKSIAILQNEFAPDNFDGKELKRHSSRDFELLEINNGSVFCVCLLSGFVQSLEQFVNYHKPDIMIIETSGLSDPISVSEIFNAPRLQSVLYLAGLICIVDATSFLKLEKLQQRMVHQVQVADIIIVNKTDISYPCSDIEEKCRRINPYSLIFKASFCNVVIEKLLHSESIRRNNYPEMVFSAEDTGRPDIFTCVLKTVKPMKEQNFSRFLHIVASKVVRLKGYILFDSGHCKALHIVMGKTETELLITPVKRTELIAMGYDLTAGDLNRLYQQYCQMN